MQYVCGIGAENGVHCRGVFVCVVGGEICLYRSGKSASVNAACALYAVRLKEMFGEAQSQRKPLLGNIFGRVYVLEISERRQSGIAHTAEERIKFVLLQRFSLSVYAAVFVEEMKGTRHGTVAARSAQRGYSCVKLILGNITKH